MRKEAHKKKREPNPGYMIFIAEISKGYDDRFDMFELL
jgi:hypothetical protein